VLYLVRLHGLGAEGVHVSHGAMGAQSKPSASVDD
jgi:hypothetical protein